MIDYIDDEGQQAGRPMSQIEIEMMSSVGRLQDRLRIAEMALKKIRREQGKVCDNYELCEHTACQSSYASWAIAAQALDEIGRVE